MGANYSSGDGHNDAAKEAHNSKSKTCYYELLGVDAKATEDE